MIGLLKDELLAFEDTADQMNKPVEIPSYVRIAHQMELDQAEIKKLYSFLGKWLDARL